MRGYEAVLELCRIALAHSTERDGVDERGATRACLFLAYSVYQQPASTDTREPLEASRKYMEVRRLSSSGQEVGNPVEDERDSAMMSNGIPG